MRTIFKYRLNVVDRQRVSMPTGAEILSVQFQSGLLHLWALVEDQTRTSEDRVFLMFGTGHDTEGEASADRYVGTVQEAARGLVWHVFEGARR